MIVKASKLRRSSAEVPIRFYKDHPGRFSHHKRAGWFSPWTAGWIEAVDELLDTYRSLVAQ